MEVDSADSVIIGHHYFFGVLRINKMTEYEVVATGLRFPEGPIAMLDGSVL